MYKVFWYWFLAIMEGVVTVRTRRVKDISDKPKERVSANGVHIKFQYFVIYFNSVFQDSI